VAAEAAETFVLTVINGSEQADLAKQFGVRIYPTTYVIDAQNRLVDRIEGYIPAEQFRRRLTVASRRLASRPDAPLPR
jgi:thioredoxin-like negative regulator of GroEL